MHEDHRALARRRVVQRLAAHGARLGPEHVRLNDQPERRRRHSAAPIADDHLAADDDRAGVVAVRCIAIGAASGRGWQRPARRERARLIARLIKLKGEQGAVKQHAQLVCSSDAARPFHRVGAVIQVAYERAHLAMYPRLAAKAERRAAAIAGIPKHVARPDKEGARLARAHAKV